MKKVLYSIPLKAAAFILCIAVIAMAAGDVLYAWSDAYQHGYNDSFEDSYEVRRILSICREKLSLMITEPDAAENYISVEDEVEYYAKNLTTNTVISNTDQKDPSYYANREYDTYYILERHGGEVNEDGNISLMLGSSGIRGADDYVLYIKIKDDVAADLYFDWLGSINRLQTVYDSIPAYAALLLLAIVYLSFAVGRKAGQDGVQMMTMDRIPVDVMLVFWILSCVLAAGGLALLLGVRRENFDIRSYSMLIAATFAAESGAIYMSAVRNLKNHTFMQNCLLGRGIKWLYAKGGILIRLMFSAAPKRFGRGLNKLYAAARKTVGARMSVKLILAALIVYTAVLALGGILMGALLYEGDAGWFVLFLLGTAWFAAAFYAVYRGLNGTDAVRNGLQRIRDGEVSYKITECKSAFASSMAEDINAIGEGLQKAVEQSVKSERMKSELITNVSHDLKTPLTSIINYTDLLMKEKLVPEEANDYVRIIDRKSKKLRQLTADLFDISKVRSGNEEIETEQIDYKLLISQAVAELDQEIQKAGLEFVLKLPESSVEIISDGKKLSRVYENLIINAVKYSLKGTRVYIELYENGSRYTTEIKNIAGYKMDFTDDEITERFVRGDESRTGDGSGLGLAIAKSYVELLGGSFSVKTDGDLFKAIIELN